MTLPLGLVVVLLLGAGLLLSRVRYCMVAAVAQTSQGHLAGSSRSCQWAVRSGRTISPSAGEG